MKCNGENCAPDHEIDKFIDEMFVKSNHISMEVKPRKWKQNLKKGLINPFNAFQSISEKLRLNSNHLTIKTNYLKSIKVDADTDYISLNNKQSFKFLDVEKTTHEQTRFWAGTDVVFISRYQVALSHKLI